MKLPLEVTKITKSLNPYSTGSWVAGLIKKQWLLKMMLVLILILLEVGLLAVNEIYNFLKGQGS